VRNAVVDLLLVRVGFGIRFANALRNHTLVALGVACVFAVFALHAGRVLEEITAERAAHDVVELLLDKLVPVHLVHFFFALTHGTLTTKTQIDLSSVLVHLVEVQLKMNLAARFQREESVNGLVGN
jgi:hypothetical protein